MTETQPKRKIDIRREEREETTRVAQEESDKRLQAAREKTARLREQRLAQVRK